MQKLLRQVEKKIACNQNDITFFYKKIWRGDRVAEGNGLLNRRADTIRTAGSNPALSVFGLKSPLSLLVTGVWLSAIFSPCFAMLRNVLLCFEHKLSEHTPSASGLPCVSCGSVWSMDFEPKLLSQRSEVDRSWVVTGYDYLGACRRLCEAEQ